MEKKAFVSPFDPVRMQNDAIEIWILYLQIVHIQQGIVTCTV